MSFHIFLWMSCFFLLDRWAWGLTHCLAHEIMVYYSIDETACMFTIFHVLPGDWNRFYTAIVKRVHWGFSCCFFHLFVLLLWSRHVARLWQGRHLGGGPVPQVLADLRLKQTCPVWDIKQDILKKVLCPGLDITCSWDPVAEGAISPWLNSGSDLQWFWKKELLFNLR